ncbi:speG [Lepeophtheirus salmonis]|uniref:SpeG n=1 Tax=Lepeophtheirus salmonis TaxID=72036 RepID=A0A7R8H6G6_LEPSM|nr:speG [Lepeophtheirus salmonis]CAF2888312.1 speG [Lepeophtheirus salmonis]
MVDISQSGEYFYDYVNTSDIVITNSNDLANFAIKRIKKGGLLLNFGGNHRIRSAVKEDCKNIIKLVQELADYQKLSDGPSLTPEKLEEDGFGSDPAFHCKVAYDGDKCVGYALYFYGFSTFYGRNAYMEDLYVSNNYRDKGIGSDLWRSAVKETLEKGCTTFDFSVLGDNFERH